MSSSNDSSSHAYNDTNHRHHNAAAANNVGCSDIFSCNKCGRNIQCIHKWGIVSEILMNPKHDSSGRTQTELRECDKDTRENVWADFIANPKATIYKLPTSDDENIDFIQQCLQQVEYEISNNIPQKDKVHYMKARDISPKYVTSQSFIMRFLRADKYDPKATVKRIVKHFQLKYQLFCSNSGGDIGDSSSDSKTTTTQEYEILGRDVTLEDLTVVEQRIVTEGSSCRFLSQPDHAGRYIFFDKPSSAKHDNIYNEVKVCVCILLVAAAAVAVCLFFLPLRVFVLLG